MTSSSNVSLYIYVYVYIYIYIRTSGLHKTLYIYAIDVHEECHAKPNKLNLLTIHQNTIRVLQCVGMSPSGQPFEKHLLEPIFKTILKNTVLQVPGNQSWKQSSVEHHFGIKTTRIWNQSRIKKKTIFWECPRKWNQSRINPKSKKKSILGKCGNNHKTIINQ